MNDKLLRLKSLLEYADNQQREISNTYTQYSDGHIPSSVQIKIKNYFENARSLLDYIAGDISVQVLRLSKKHKCYFPIGCRSEDELRRFCRKNFPGLEHAGPEIYRVLASIQPFKTAEFSSLKLLAEYTNENKHRDLTAQVMVKEFHSASRFKVIRLGDSVTPASADGCQGFLIADETRSDPFLGSEYILDSIGKVIDLNPASIQYVSFKFNSSGGDVIVTLMDIQESVRKAVERFEEVLYKNRIGFGG